MLLILIKLIHFIIVVLIGLSPFINVYKIKYYSFIFLIYLLFQYISGYQKCGLTQLEYYVMGKNYEEGFLYRLINPLIKVPEHYFNKYIICIHLIYIIILFNQIYL